MNILENLKQGIKTDSPEATAACGEAVAMVLPENHTLALAGDLGTGKTTFVRGLANFWQITENITSPTYNIFFRYRGVRNLIHLDAYRLENERQWDDLMIEDFLLPPFCLAIEWPEKAGSRLPADIWTLRFSIAEPGSHVIQWVSDASV
jgi:tRNA threonylcarbamoyladenosine biosynthesis protein TsaE